VSTRPSIFTSILRVEILWKTAIAGPAKGQEWVKVSGLLVDEKNRGRNIIDHYGYRPSVNGSSIQTHSLAHYRGAAVVIVIQ
jgi:hypothetical protein